MYEKKMTRMRRALRSRMKIREKGSLRLTVHRSAKHIYAQIISSANGRCDEVMVSASTLDKQLKSGVTGNIKAAVKVGTLLAERAILVNISTVVFDRSGFKYHGRVEAVATAARKAGLQF